MLDAFCRNYSSAITRKRTLQRQRMVVDSDSRITMQNYSAWLNSVAKEVGLILQTEKYIAITQIFRFCVVLLARRSSWLAVF